MFRSLFTLLMLALAVAMPYPEDEGPIVVSPEVLDTVASLDELAEDEKVDERYRPNYGQLQRRTVYQQQSSSHQQQSSSLTTHQQLGYQNTGYHANNAAGGYGGSGYHTPGVNAGYGQNINYGQSGYGNTGSINTGYGNTGSINTGYGNTGFGNTGYGIGSGINTG
ncbi:uncharacterized transmembrane protein DDB_G0289901-like [Daphnia carinata]|uniref:uncharacterized transmembrane protein DDB_G0289901-like n=1 Tax=Daphnia carinata TaxID=120202 RepID=UPI00257D8E3C|nr:uncharacterized transmembrane protein DDB_G0289901-like [Daphnia carinata]